MGVERRRKLLRSDELGAIPPAPSCSFTFIAPGLTGAFGWNAAQVDGQRIFIDSVGSTGSFGASTDQNSPIPFWSSGVRWMEARNNSRSDRANTATNMYFAAPDGSRSVQLRCSANSSNWQLVTNLAGTDQTVETLIANYPDPIAIGIDGATGDIKAWGPSGEITLPSGFTGFWGGEDVVLVGGISAAITGVSGSITVGTAAPYANSPTGQDMCGNTL